MTQQPDCHYRTKRWPGEDPPPGGWLVADEDLSLLGPHL
jgi:hypothetical protein